MAGRRMLPLLLLVAALIIGCGDGKGNAGDANVVIPTQSRGAATYEAAVSGELFRAGACLFLEADFGTVYTILWPHGTTAAEVDGVVEVRYPNGDRFARVGDTIMLGGGEAPTLSVPECGGLVWAASFMGG